MPRLTIFTPTYNRKHLLPTLYESLKSQTNKDFVWLVIDDGSTDGTEEYFSKINNAGFELQYVKKENGGKHTAIDMANGICKTDYIVCVDSDDYLTDNAVECMYKEIEKIDEYPNVCGVVTRRRKPTGEPFMENWAKSDEILKFHDLADKYGYTTDTCLLFKTSIIKQFHFPTFEGERFVTESVFYNQFMYDYDMLASDNLYYVAEYMPDGYTAQGVRLFFRNPRGHAYALKQNAYMYIYNGGTLKRKLGGSAYFYAWCKLMKINSNEMSQKYKLGFYGFVGRMLKFIPYRKFKKEYESYKEENGKK